MNDSNKEIQTNIFLSNIQLGVDTDYWKEKVIDLHKNNRYVPHVHSIPLGEEFRELTQALFKVLYKECNDIFGTIDPITGVNCSAYVSNKNWYRNGIHHHKAMSVINSVFYLSVPSKTSGGISFFKDPSESTNEENLVEGYDKYYTYQPNDNDLLIFPNYFLHNPEFSDTDEFRVSLNMEIYCADVWTKRLINKKRLKFNH